MSLLYKTYYNETHSAKETCECIAFTHQRRRYEASKNSWLIIHEFKIYAACSTTVWFSSVSIQFAKPLICLNYGLNGLTVFLFSIFLKKFTKF